YLCTLHLQKLGKIQMNDNDRLKIFIYDDVILIQNQFGKIKEFPRCEITNVKSFVLEMVKTGNLDDLLM
ncbi:MAG: hypothetical protein PVI88_02295, partial [Nitrosopumilaceae archaeon]